MTKKVIENQFTLLRILAAPLTAPWNRGDTRIFLALLGLAFWLGFTVAWWMPIVVCVLILISGIAYSATSHREWEEDMIETLRQEVVWNCQNRNVLAQKYNAYYAGLPGDDNDPENWKEYAPGETWRDVAYGEDRAP